MSNDNARELYSRFIETMRSQGWTDADVADYAEQIRILMGKDDEAATALFPDGLYETAAEARNAAVQYWSNAK